MTDTNVTKNPVLNPNPNHTPTPHTLQPKGTPMIRFNVKHTLTLAAALAAVSSLGVAPQADAAGFHNFGGATVVNEGSSTNPYVVKVDTSVAPNFGGIAYTPDTGTTIADLTHLSIDYQITAGSLGAGTPRFILNDGTANGNAFVYLGDSNGGGSYSDPSPGNWNSSGNYIDLTSTDTRFELHGFDGQSGGTPPYKTYSEFISAVSPTTPLAEVDVVFDPSNGNQTGLIDNFTVNSDNYNATAVPEPASLALLGLGLGGLLVRRPGKKKQA